jgi:hypothetical protein
MQMRATLKPQGEINVSVAHNIAAAIERFLDQLENKLAKHPINVAIFIVCFPPPKFPNSSAACTKRKIAHIRHEWGCV